MTKPMMRGTKEASRERTRGSNSAAWPGAALPVRGTPEPLDCCGFVHLFIADRTRVLVAVVFLDCRVAGRRTDLADAASVGWIVFLLRGGAHVRLLGAADEEHG